MYPPVGTLKANHSRREHAVFLACLDVHSNNLCVRSCTAERTVRHARPGLARLSALMTGIMTLVSCLTLMGVALALRRQLSMAFSNDPQVIAVAAAAMPILAGSLLGDGVNCAASGVLSSAGYRCHMRRGFSVAL